MHTDLIIVFLVIGKYRELGIITALELNPCFRQICSEKPNNGTEDIIYGKCSRQVEGTTTNIYFPSEVDCPALWEHGFPAVKMHIYWLSYLDYIWFIQLTIPYA